MEQEDMSWYLRQKILEEYVSNPRKGSNTMAFTVDCRRNEGNGRGRDPKWPRPSRLGAVFLLSCLLFLAGSTQAEEDWTPYFPKVADLPSKQVSPPMVLIQVGEPLPPVLRFAIPLPESNWKRVKELPEQEGTQVLASITAPGGLAFGLVEVHTLVPPQEVNQLDFLHYLMKLNETTPIRARITFASGGLTSEALGIIPAPQGSSDEPIVMRAAVYRSGKRFFLVRCQAAKSHFLSLSQAFAVVTGFFSPQVLTAPALIGNWRTYCLANQICYTGPDEGWNRLSSAKDQFEDAFALSTGEVNTGFLHLKAIQAPLSQATSPLDRIDVLTESLASQGLKVVQKEPAFTFDHANLEAKFHGQTIHCKDSNDQPVDLMVASGLTPKGAVVVWVITVSKELDPWAWMANKRAFEVVFDSLKP
jgi:hypothetical protein